MLFYVCIYLRRLVNAFARVCTAMALGSVQQQHVLKTRKKEKRIGALAGRRVSWQRYLFGPFLSPFSSSPRSCQEAFKHRGWRRKIPSQKDSKAQIAVAREL